MLARAAAGGAAGRSVRRCSAAALASFSRLKALLVGRGGAVAANAAAVVAVFVKLGKLCILFILP